MTGAFKNSPEVLSQSPKGSGKTRKGGMNKGYKDVTDVAYTVRAELGQS